MIITLMVILFGLDGLNKLASESFPNVNLGIVKIKTYYDGASATDVELKISKPIEQEMKSISGLKKVKSISQPGFSAITTMVDIDNHDPDEVVADVRRALDSVTDLPSDLRNPPSFFEVKSEEIPALELAITGGKTTRERLEVAERLKEKLEDNQKISEIIIAGDLKRQYVINVDPEKLVKNKVSLNQVKNSIKLRNLNIPGGFIEQDLKQNLIKLEGKIKDLDDLKKVVVRSNLAGKTIYLRDIGKIVSSNEDPTFIATYNGEPAILVIIKRNPVRISSN